jgi:spore germination cell wall hydrolase CwlJ-like protein
LVPAVLLGLTTSCVPAAAGRSLDAAAGAAAGAGDRAARALRLPYRLAGLLLADPVVTGAARPEAAAPFRPRERNARSGARALECLTAAVYHEARSEGLRGQRAVAQVVLNRVRHFAYPSSICGVVFQGPMRAGGGCQFTFTCDGSLKRPRDAAAWARVETVARAALDGFVEESVGWATHYHTDYVRPRWGARLVPVNTLGAHIFYRMPGSDGAAAAFVRRSASLEPVAGRGPARPEARGIGKGAGVRAAAGEVKEASGLGAV